MGLVLIAAPLRAQDSYWSRWIHCFDLLSYQDKRCCVASEDGPTRFYVAHHWPYVKVLPFDVWRPPFTPERIYAITAGREAIRRYVCEDPGVDWLLLIDIDVNYPPDTVQKVLELAGGGFDVVFSRKPGLLSLIHRDVCSSVAFVTGVNFRNQRSTLEEHFQVERQLEVYNSTRPGAPFFKVREVNLAWLQHRESPVGVYP